MTAADYMAEAGKKVLVLEKNSQAGGGLISVNITSEMYPKIANDAVALLSLLLRSMGGPAAPLRL